MQERNDPNNEQAFGMTPVAPPGAQSAAMSLPPRTSGLAVASMIVGIGSLCLSVLLVCLWPLEVVPFISSIVGLILGIVALRRIKQSGSELGGRGAAITGVITSSIAEGISLLVFVLLATLFPGALQKARETAKSLVAENEAMTCAFIMDDYLINNDEWFPPPAEWDQMVMQYKNNNPGSFRLDLPHQFAMNENLYRMRSSDVPSPQSTVMLFEVSAAELEPFGGRELLPAEPIYGNAHLIVFVDGSIRRVTADGIDLLIWDPATDSP